MRRVAGCTGTGRASQGGRSNRINPELYLQEQLTAERKGSAPHSWHAASSPSAPPAAPLPSQLQSRTPSLR